MSILFDAVEGGAADAPRGHIEDPPHGFVVLRIHEQPEVGEDILHFLAAVKLGSADDDVVNAFAAQGLFDEPGLSVRPVKDGDVPGRAFPFRNVFGDELGFGLAVFRKAETHRLAALFAGPERFSEPVQVVRDECIRGLEDGFCAAVVLLETIDLRVREVLGEIEDVVDVRAAPGVNALVLVADGEEVAMSFAEPARDEVLRPVRILIFVDVHVAVAALIAIPNLRMIFQEPHRQHEEIVEIDGARAFQGLVIAGPQFAVRLFQFVDGRGVSLRGVGTLFEAAEPGERLPGRYPLKALRQILDLFLHDGKLIRIVEDRERLGPSQPVHVPAQQEEAKGVEGAEPRAGPFDTQAPGETLAHFARGLVCERQGQQMARIDAALLNQP